MTLKLDISHIYEKQTQGRGQFSLYSFSGNFENLLLKNCWSNFNIISQKWSLGGPLPKLFKELWYVKKHGRQGRGQFSLYSYIGNFENLLPKTADPISTLFHRNDPLVNLYQNCSKNNDMSKNMAARGVTSFPYIAK